MKTQSDAPDDLDLDALLDAARTRPIADDQGADAAFMARVLADALAVQSVAQAKMPPRRAGFWTRMAAALGGAVAVAGIGTAAMAGLVIGYVQPDSMVELAGTIGLGSGESLELLPGFDALLTEDLLQ